MMPKSEWQTPEWVLEPGVNTNFGHLISRRDRYIQLDQDFTRPGLRCFEGLDLGRNLSGFIVNASLVLLGNLGHFESDYRQIEVLQKVKM